MPITLTWTGHATWLIDTGKGTLLIDPFFDECPTASMKARDVACDAILVTHGHFDHVADLVAIAKWTGAMVYCNWEIAQWLGKHGVQNVQPMNLGGSVAVPGGRAKMEIAHHSSSLPDGSYGGNPAGWLLDVAVLPIGDLFTMGPDDAVRLLKPKLALPSHYGTWPRIEQDAIAWARRVEAAGLAAAKAPAVGEPLTIG